jgi:hypothetical protein
VAFLCAIFHKTFNATGMPCGVFLFLGRNDYMKEVIGMTIHLLFVTLTVERKKKTIDQVQYEEQVYKSYEAMMNKCFQMYNGN